ncbi:MAG: nucleoside-diphosphate kinase [Brevinematia bacterium]
MEKTLFIIKPDAVAKKKIGKIISIIEESGIEILAMKMTKLTVSEAEEFYKEHKGKDFFQRLIEFMISGPIVVMVLSGENIIHRVRDIIGDTDPRKAKEGTIRKLFGEDLPRNAVHASDSIASSQREIGFFFNI